MMRRKKKILSFRKFLMIKHTSDLNKLITGTINQKKQKLIRKKEVRVEVKAEAKVGKNMEDFQIPQLLLSRFPKIQ